MSSSKAFSLGKSERLKSRKQIDLLFDKGRKITVFPFRLIYICTPAGGELKAGFTVSSKNFPRAVDRNRIKRLTREGYRVQKRDLQDMAVKNKQLVHLFFIYTAKEILTYQEISIHLKKLLDRLIQNLHAPNISNT
jgi:ribonuclease P protein component